MENFGISLKVIKLVKMTLDEAKAEVIVGKHIVNRTHRYMDM